jgi:ABC-type multidrug transport system ATPase subunit
MNSAFRDEGTTQMDTAAIDIRGLRKSYGDKSVLDGVDLTVREGTVTALLGPNGAGKTTIVHILSTLLRPDGGAASVAGCDVVRDADGVRAAIGLTGQFSAVDKLLTGEENLMLIALAAPPRCRTLKGSGRRTTRAVRPRRSSAQAARYLLGRDAAPPGSRDDSRD